MSMPASDLPIIPFATSAKMEAWLKKNHDSSAGIWIQFYKKESGKPTITRDEAIDVALCYGWIDSQLLRHDSESWLHRFTPRSKRSIWSKRNIKSVKRLIKEKRMTAAGMKEVEAAKKDGRWERAYDMSKDMKVPADFLKELRKDKKAYAFFETLNKANTYAIAWRLQTAKKPETREKRFKAMLEMMKKGKKLH
jgi:uncharacterized protein YdeI (YjbR/CyaY-like superfamily)